MVVLGWVLGELGELGGWERQFVSFDTLFLKKLNKLYTLVGGKGRHAGNKAYHRHDRPPLARQIFRGGFTAVAERSCLGTATL